MKKILAIDPSVTNTGMCVIEYDESISYDLASAYKVTYCQTVRKSAKAVKKNGILDMIYRLQIESQKDCYKDVDYVIIESPSASFLYKGSGVVPAIAHIAGACIALFDVRKCYIFRPTEWNRARSKVVIHSEASMYLGLPDTWHYEAKTPTKAIEHIQDASAMGLWFIRSGYLEEEEVVVVDEKPKQPRHKTKKQEILSVEGELPEIQTPEGMDVSDLLEQIRKKAREVNGETEQEEENVF